MMNSTKSLLKFDGSHFMKFLYFYLLHIRTQMWQQHQVESEGMYAVSQTISAILREITASNSAKSGQFGEVLTQEINLALAELETLSPCESEVILSLLPGGECNVITAGDIAISSSGDFVTIIGFTDCWIDAVNLP
jgi:hypothetical protein